MRQHRVELGDRSYNIWIEDESLGETGPRLRELVQPTRAAVVADETVAGLYADGVLGSLRQAGIEADLVTFPPGEESKSLDQLGRLCDRFVQLGLDRRSVVVALGGGVCGDLAGFAAGTYMRGIDFLQVPTTLLAMVDSSSGGKTGVNLPRGKNLVGVFHQPCGVLIDPTTLRSLPKREFGCGLAEIAKHGAILDAGYFQQVEREAEAILALDSHALADAIHGSVRIKAAVVTADEREKGLRALLNFGHTFGHAYEALSDYRLPHGEAVAAGMVAACHAGERILGTAPEVRERLLALLAKLHLPTRAPSHDVDEVVARMREDKKSERGGLRLVLLEEIGRAKVVPVEDLAPIRDAIAAAAE